ncbi:hypothetical protein [Streptomyces filipinensis]|nr:hypothetical protein [Streptomyces filipinensis]
MLRAAGIRHTYHRDLGRTLVSSVDSTDAEGDGAHPVARRIVLDAVSRP